uniref:ATP-dependent protease subunit HslV n=1 Tax=Ammonifex degensii TaxID=42838 RepID=A0A7C1JL32_9THEO
MLRGTTIIAVKKEERVAVAGDGQVTLGQDTIIKQGARKVRRLYQGKVIAGFAGSVADALALFDRFEGQLEETQGNLLRAAVNLAKEWRTDKLLRRLEAALVVADRQHLLMVTGSGEVIEPDDGIVALGSGGSLALAAARALLRHTAYDASTIAQEALRIAASICVYTNEQITVEEL